MSSLTPAAGRVRRIAPSTLVHIAQRPTCRHLARPVHARWLAAVAAEASTNNKDSLARMLPLKSCDWQR